MIRQIDGKWRYVTKATTEEFNELMQEPEQLLKEISMSKVKTFLKKAVSDTKRIAEGFLQGAIGSLVVTTGISSTDELKKIGLSAATAGAFAVLAMLRNALAKSGDVNA